MNGVNVDVKLRRIALENRLWPFVLSNDLELYKIPDIEHNTTIFRFVKRGPDRSKRGVDFAIYNDNLLGDINRLADIVIRDVTRELLG